MTCKKCEKPVRARGLCIGHYSLWRRGNEVARPYTKADIDYDEFWLFVKKELRIG